MAHIMKFNEYGRSVYEKMKIVPLNDDEFNKINPDVPSLGDGKLYPGDVIKIEGDVRPYEYLLVISNDDYTKLFGPGHIDSSFGDSIIVSDEYGGCFTTGVWDKDYKNTDPDFLENGDIVEIYREAADKRTRTSKKFWSSDDLEKLVRDMKPTIKLK